VSRFPNCPICGKRFVEGDLVFRLRQWGRDLSERDVHLSCIQRLRVGSISDQAWGKKPADKGRGDEDSVDEDSVD